MAFPSCELEPNVLPKMTSDLKFYHTRCLCNPMSSGTHRALKLPFPPVNRRHVVVQGNLDAETLQADCASKGPFSLYAPDNGGQD